MIEAVRTHASPMAIWAIVVVAVACLAFWLTMVMLADRQQVRASGPSVLGPELAGAQSGADGISAAQAGTAQADTAQVGAGRQDLPDGIWVPGQRDAEVPTEPIPAQAPPTATDRPARPTMPAQRTAAGDRAERSGTADRDQR